MRCVSRSNLCRVQVMAGPARDVSVRKCQSRRLRPSFFSTQSASSLSSFAPSPWRAWSFCEKRRARAGGTPHARRQTFRPARKDALAHVRLDEVQNLCAQSRKYRGGKFAGAAMQYQVATSNPGSASATAGMTESTGWRTDAVIVSPRRLFLIASCLGGVFANKIAVILTAYQIGERRPRTFGRARSASRHQNVEFTRARSASHGWAISGVQLALFALLREGGMGYDAARVSRACWRNRSLR